MSNTPTLADCILCAWCKSYVDRDTGFKVLRLTDAEFEATRNSGYNSHGICPACGAREMRKLKRARQVKPLIVGATVRVIEVHDSPIVGDKRNVGRIGVVEAALLDKLAIKNGFDEWASVDIDNTPYKVRFSDGKPRNGQHWLDAQAELPSDCSVHFGDELEVLQ